MSGIKLAFVTQQIATEIKVKRKSQEKVVITEFLVHFIQKNIL